MTEPALSIHTSNRLEVLAEHLAATLAAQPLPTLEREVVVVQSQGMRRWLTLQLADRLGIAAGLTLPFPGVFCRQLAERLDDGRGSPTADEAGRPAPSLFDRELLTWRIFDRLGDDGIWDGAGAASPAAYLEDDPDQIKRYQLSVRIAGLFDDYQLFRPQMMLEWESGAPREAAPREASLPNAGRKDAAHADWQARLWRALTADSPADRIGEDHLARRLNQLLDRLRRSDRPHGLPRRLTVFGSSTLPPTFIAVLSATARFIPVRIYFTSPTYEFWGDVRSEREATRIRLAGGDDRRAEGAPGEHAEGAPGEHAEGAPGEHLEVGNPLLASLGRQGRDFFNLLQDADPGGAAWQELELVDPGDDCLLHAVQSDILHLVDRGSPEAPPQQLADGDNSLRVHACHSPRREMEVLRDQLLDAFVRDPSLEPSDVVVMVPEISDYSPYVEAVFGVEWAGTPALPFAIADRQASAERPLAETVLSLLDLVASRVTPRAVFDLLDTPAVRRAFRIPSGDVPVLRQWIRDTRIRWGMDGTQRAADFGLPGEQANTWLAGLDRLLMGYASGGRQEMVGGVAPHAGSTAGDAELLGRLAAFVDTLFRHLRALREPRPADVWAAALGDALEDLYQAEGEDEESALELVRDAFEELSQARLLAGVAESFGPKVVRAHLAGSLAAEGFGSGFLSGRITFCALKPMRTIPFKVICVAGLSDGAFPRRDARRSFDLMVHDPRPGDRSRTEDDRYLFLETLLAAGDRLILTYEGRSEKDNRRKAPAVVVSELLDNLDRAFTTGDGRPARDLLVVEHRLHSFNPEYYAAGADPRLFSYSRESCRAGRSYGERRSAAPFVPDFADGAEDFEADGSVLEVELPELTELWVHPAKHYCRQVLQLVLDPAASEVDESEPFGVGFLDRYRINQWLLERRLTSDPSGEPELELLRSRGELPLAGLGDAHYAELGRQVDRFVETLPRYQPLEPVLIEVAGDGWRLHGRLEELTDAGVLRFRCANLKPKDLVRAWVAHLARAAWEAGSPSDPPLITHVIGTDRGVRFGTVENAAEILASLVAGYRQGLQRPLPLFEGASHAFVLQRRKLADGGRAATPGLVAARRAFEGDRFPGDRAEPYTALCFRDRDPLADAEFVRWSETLWGPLLDHAEDV